MGDGLRVTGWGRFGWPGEKKRIEAAMKKADQTLSQIQGPMMDVTVETTYDFSTGSVRLSVDETVDPVAMSVEDQKELRASIISALLDEASLFDLPVPPDSGQIEWERVEAAGRVFITATLSLED